MTDPTCDTCGHEKAMGRCWRLTCPTNGGTAALMDRLINNQVSQPTNESLLDDLRRYGTAITKADKRIDPADFYAQPEQETLL